MQAIKHRLVSYKYLKKNIRCHGGCFVYDLMIKD